MRLLARPARIRGAGTIVDERPFSHDDVLRRAHALRVAGWSRWLLDGADYAVGGYWMSHVDFVLRCPNARTFLVSEWQRADPRAHWCFARAAYTRPDPRASPAAAQVPSAKMASRPPPAGGGRLPDAPSVQRVASVG